MGYYYYYYYYNICINFDQDIHYFFFCILPRAYDNKISYLLNCTSVKVYNANNSNRFIFVVQKSPQLSGYRLSRPLRLCSSWLWHIQYSVVAVVYAYRNDCLFIYLLHLLFSHNLHCKAFGFFMTLLRLKHNAKFSSIQLPFAILLVGT